MLQTLLDGSVMSKTEVLYEWIGTFSKRELEIDKDPPWMFVLERISECVRIRELEVDERKS